MSGWSFFTWVEKNKDTLKFLVMGMAAIGTFFVTKNMSPELQTVIVPVVTGVAKLLADTIDFYLSRVQI